MVVISTPPEIIHYLKKINGYTKENLYSMIMFLLDLGQALISGADEETMSFNDVDNYINYQHDILNNFSDEELLTDRMILENVAINLASMARLNNIDNPYIINGDDVIISIGNSEFY